MTAVLHATDPARRAVLDGSPILPVDGRRCPECGGCGWIAEPDPATGEPINPQQCPTCRGDAVLPPVLSGRFTVAVDGAIVGTATAEEVLPVVDDIEKVPPDSNGVEVLGGVVVIFGSEKREDSPDAKPYREGKVVRDGEGQALSAAVLDLRPGGWVVLLSDAAPTTERCPECWGSRFMFYRRFNGGAGGSFREECHTCGSDGSCPPVPVESAPAGTVTTWEAG